MKVFVEAEKIFFLKIDCRVTNTRKKAIVRRCAVRYAQGDDNLRSKLSTPLGTEEYLYWF